MICGFRDMRNVDVSRGLGPNICRHRDVKVSTSSDHLISLSERASERMDRDALIKPEVTFLTGPYWAKFIVLVFHQFRPPPASHGTPPVKRKLHPLLLLLEPLLRSTRIPGKSSICEVIKDTDTAPRLATVPQTRVRSTR